LCSGEFAEIKHDLAEKRKGMSFAGIDMGAATAKSVVLPDEKSW
jgi:activator of 2-hydroxyglutaryl-CoA dehydratase